MQQSQCLQMAQRGVDTELSFAVLQGRSVVEQQATQGLDLQGLTVGQFEQFKGQRIEKVSVTGGLIKNHAADITVPVPANLSNA